jgi:hypothetical protein
LVEVGEHLRRVFDLVLSSTALEAAAAILDCPDDLKVSPIKIEVLRVVGLLSAGSKLFSPGSEIQLLSED